ncbi:hypothetical protein COLO4_28488 [Corchorus olitorius]|uniref:Uncharacterized protein n=1 Tax=Corchorus olitorius TaxID=93759 RepID=A0A1R3HKH5_9ROSI|nr:hypothetical protein COLO4_28488 [Corchorus olitorius]
MEESKKKHQRGFQRSKSHDDEEPLLQPQPSSSAKVSPVVSDIESAQPKA